MMPLGPTATSVAASPPPPAPVAPRAQTRPPAGVSRSRYGWFPAADPVSEPRAVAPLNRDTVSWNEPVTTRSPPGARAAEYAVAADPAAPCKVRTHSTAPAG